MRAWPVGVVLSLALAACGGGGTEAAPSPSGAPTSSAPAAAELTQEAQGVRDAVRAALDACPCQVEVHANASGKGGAYYALDLEGVYDADARTAELTPSRTREEIAIRVVDGATFFTPTPKAGAKAPWLALDFSKLPATAVSQLGTMAVVDPTLGFAVAAGTNTATTEQAVRKGHTLYETSFQVPTAVEAAGGAGELLRRLFSTDDEYADVRIDDKGRLAAVSFDTPPVEGQDGSMSVSFTITAFGVKAPRVTRPRQVVRTVDVTTAVTG